MKKTKKSTKQIKLNSAKKIKLNGNNIVVTSDRPFLIGVSGGSGSGKTYFAKALQNKLGEKNCTIVLQDNFYFDQSRKFDHDGGNVNFDHPDSIDFNLLTSCLRDLKKNKKTNIPVYDFSTHTRSHNALQISPHPVIIVDGILILHAEKVREVLDMSIFFEAPEDLRFKRRLERDVIERGRTPEGVKIQFDKQVKPMHDLYVEPSKMFANQIIREQKDFYEVIESVCSRFINLKIK